jgi:predicted ribosomally synthesized peptide with SipW-like signal peptide
MRKIGLLMLALVIALGALGAGYAYWTQTINVSAAVQTGDLNAVFAGDDAVDAWADAPDYVAYYTTSGNGSELLTVTIKNAYPGMTATIPVVIKNNGTIPIGGIVGVSNTSWLPVGSAVVLSGTELGTGLVKNQSTSDAKITVSIPFVYGNAYDSKLDPAFVEQNTASYAFTMAITSTQFVPSNTIDIKP